MIRKISGKIVDKHNNVVIVETCGVGFEIEVPPSYNLPSIGKEIALWTYLRIREDALDLFGFLSIEELNLFEAMMKVSRLPARTGLSIISNKGVQGFQKLLAENDVAALTSIPGVGKKTAQQLLLELSGKINFDELPGTDFENNSLDDPTRGLIELGYSVQDAKKIVKRIKEDKPEISDTAEIIKLALQRGR